MLFYQHSRLFIPLETNKLNPAVKYFSILVRIVTLLSKFLVCQDVLAREKLVRRL